MDLGLAGRIALVTGGSRGIGRATALRLAAEGADVAITYQRDAAAAQAVLRAIEAAGRRGAALRADLAEPGAGRGVVEAAAARLGPVAILVNNAATWPTNRVADIPPAEWDHVLALNLRAVFETCQAFVRAALAAGRAGSILNVTSQAAFYGSTTGHAHYAASKAGVVAFTISLAREVARDGINVNALALGMVETDMSRPAIEARRDYYLSRIPLGRIGTPEEIAGIAAFLVSEQARYMTGATVDATGGMLMR